MRRTISNILIIVFSAIIAFSGYRLYTIFHEYHEGEKQYKETAENYIRKPDPPKTPDDPLTTCPISVDFESLLAENSDVVGWIYSDGTQINYPVLRGESNESYIHTMINGEYNSAGSIFMDFRNNPDLSDINTILYGHHMKNGSMFASLHKYSDQTYFEEHSYIWYLTPQGNYRINVISGFIENAVAPVYGLFEDEESFREFVDYAIAKSDFQSRYDYSKAEHLMVLSTCSYEYDDARYIIVGIPIPESK